jgi:EDD domain protein, DegV family
MKTAIITDSNSGITQSMGNNLGIYVLPMPFLIDGQSFYEDINLTQDKFFEKLEKSFEVSTSQPSADDVTALWDKALSEYDEAVYIPMSSGLSGSCDTAEMLSQQPKYKDKIYVIDNHRISITQRESIMDAVQLSKMGKTGSEIKQILIDTMSEASIYIMPATLWYLKRGGRITTAAAAIGTILKILPVLQIQGGKLEAFAKVKGIKAGKKQ